MINLTKKQFILIGLVTFLILSIIFFYIWKNNKEILETDIDLEGNILENTSNTDISEKTEEISYIIIHVTRSC